MQKPSLLILALAFFGMIAPGSAAPTTSPAQPLVRAIMLSDVKTIQPGKTFQVGVLLTLRSGWHVYWQNPGDSGIATSVSFTLPRGITAGPVQFPVPQQFQADNAITYGYEHAVMLITTMTAADDLAPGAAVDIVAKVNWLCCNKECIPGHASVKLSLPVKAAKPVANLADLFPSWLKHMPVELGTPKAQATAAATVVKATQTSIAYAIDLKWKVHTPSHLRVLPIPEDSLSVSDIEIKSTDDTTHISLTLSVLKGLKVKTDKMPVIIAYDTNSGPRGIMTSVPTQFGPVQSSKPVK